MSNGIAEIGNRPPDAAGENNCQDKYKIVPGGYEIPGGPREMQPRYCNDRKRVVFVPFAGRKVGKGQVDGILGRQTYRSCSGDMGMWDGSGTRGFDKRVVKRM
jgi:hypothetical protein